MASSLGRCRSRSKSLSERFWLLGKKRSTALRGGVNCGKFAQNGSADYAEWQAP